MDAMTDILRRRFFWNWKSQETRSTRGPFG